MNISCTCQILIYNRTLVTRRLTKYGHEFNPQVPSSHFPYSFLHSDSVPTHFSITAVQPASYKITLLRAVLPADRRLVQNCWRSSYVDSLENYDIGLVARFRGDQSVFHYIYLGQELRGLCRCQCITYLLMREQAATIQREIKKALNYQLAIGVRYRFCIVSNHFVKWLQPFEQRTMFNSCSLKRVFEARYSNKRELQ